MPNGATSSAAENSRVIRGASVGLALLAVEFAVDPRRGFVTERGDGRMVSGFEAVEHVESSLCAVGDVGSEGGEVDTVEQRAAILRLQSCLDQLGDDGGPDGQPPCC